MKFHVAPIVASLALALALVAFPIEEVHAQQRQSSFEDPFNPGTIDLSIGLGGLFYNWVEPGLDFGVIPVSDLGVISFGGSVNAGYCLVGCGLLNFIFQPLRITAWHVSPLAKVNFHLNALPRALNIEQVDVFGGIAVGAAYQIVALTVTDQPGDRADFSGLTALFGPMLGLRYTLSGNTGFFLYGEWRYLAEIGSQDFRLTTTDGQVYDQTDLISRGGTNTSFGLGFRF